MTDRADTLAGRIESDAQRVTAAVFDDLPSLEEAARRAGYREGYRAAVKRIAEWLRGPEARGIIERENE